MSFISQIELNQASPTVVNLQKICRALDYAISDLLREEVSLPQAMTLNSQTSLSAMRWHKARLKHVLPPEMKQSFTLLLLQIEGHGSTPSRMAQSSRNEVAFVVKGRVCLELESQKIHLEAGQTVYFDLAKEHSWFNLDDESAEILLINGYSFRLFEQEEEDTRWFLRSRPSLLSKVEMASP